MTEPIRLHTVRFVIGSYPRMSRSGFHKFISAQVVYGGLTQQEAEFILTKLHYKREDQSWAE
jgi:hypothetical protein